LVLKVYNTLTRKKEEFVPLHGNRVNMFVCGLTPYDYAHLGTAKTFVAFDTIAKYLRYKGYSVFYVQNVTDVDDKIIARAKEMGTSEKQLAERFFKEFLADMAALGVDSINLYPKSTDYIPEIIEQIQVLMEKGYAYHVDGNVYYEVGKFDGFGKLSGQRMESLEPGARVEVDERKRNPEDFVLWKAQKPGEPAWESPWGRGRPGWHIEDTAMTIYHFGNQYDVHGGAMDLIFPHHEAEIAQAEAYTGVRPFVRYWLHAGLLNIRGERMGKSKGNFIPVREVLKRYEPEVVRFFLLYNHYRSPIDFDYKLLEEAKQSYERLLETIRNLNHALTKAGEATTKSKADEELEKSIEIVMRKFEESMDDDFNTRQAIAAIFDFSREVNKALEKDLGKETLEGVSRTFVTLGSILGLFQKREEMETKRLEGLLNLITEIREETRKKKDFELSDKIRKRLLDLGIFLEDTKEGVRRKIRPV